MVKNGKPRLAELRRGTCDAVSGMSQLTTGITTTAKAASEADQLNNRSSSVSDLTANSEATMEVFCLKNENAALQMTIQRMEEQLANALEDDETNKNEFESLK